MSLGTGSREGLPLPHDREKKGFLFSRCNSKPYQGSLKQNRKDVIALNFLKSFSKMKIVIENLNDGDIVPGGVLLIRGRLSPSPVREEIQEEQL